MQPANAFIACAIVLACWFRVLPVSRSGLSRGPEFNDSGYNYGLPYGSGNTGLYVRDVEGGEQIESRSGPHGGYSATTRKCADCHSVHDAPGSGCMLSERIQSLRHL